MGLDEEKDALLHPKDSLRTGYSEVVRLLPGLPLVLWGAVREKSENFET